MVPGHSWLNAVGPRARLRALAAACARRQPAVSRLTSRILLAVAIGLAIDCCLLKGWSAETPSLALAAVEAPELMVEGDEGISLPFQALFLGLLAGAGGTAAILADAGVRLGAALHRRAVRETSGVTAQPEAARPRVLRDRDPRR